MRRFLTLLAVLALAAVGIAAAARGANGNSESTITGSEAIGPLTFSASNCSELTTDVTLTGTEEFAFHLSFNAKGIGRLSGAEAIHGTGVGTDGTTYRFNYHDTVSAPFTGFPAELSITDHFNLIGSDGSHIHMFFTAIFTVSGFGEDDLIAFEPHIVIGDPEFCDPL
jgi:hypothetical protein